jgi:hypothetical protein
VKTTKILAIMMLGLLAGCAAPQKLVKDYSAFRSHDPHSILVVPVLNNTTSLTAQDYFLSTITKPFAERGYYVFPANMVKSILQKDGLSDTGLIYKANPVRFGQLFGCDSVLFIEINKWESQYAVISTSTNVAFHYKLASCRDGAVLWEDDQELSYSPQAAYSANPLAALVAAAIQAAIEKAEPNYMPLASQANLQAAATVGKGIPAGPYSSDYKRDASQFPGK